MLQSMLTIWLTTFVFAVAHSLLATNRCKQWFGVHGMVEPRYRLTYSILSVLLTAVWLIYIHTLPDRPLYSANGLLFYIMIVVQMAGGIVVMAAFRPIDTLAFLGIQAAGDHVDPFIVSGIYRHIRHPMYSGVMLMLLASPWQSVNSLNLALAISVYFLIGYRFEEQRMIAQHPDYTAYRMRVPAFIPRR